MSQSIIKYTPTVAELQPDYTIKCTTADCDSTFNNRSHYQMHIERHHKIKLEKLATTTTYHCPIEGCIYHVASQSGRSFPNIKQLKQHFRKVHQEKSHICLGCTKRYISSATLVAHQQSGTCGRLYKCDECGWEYASREALLTHARRKGHAITESVTAKKRQYGDDILRMNAKVSAKKLGTLHPQVVDPHSIELTYKDKDDLISSLLRDIHTQTELQTQNATVTTTSSEEYAAHMQTQTCAELYAEMDLSEMEGMSKANNLNTQQTQTNWPFEAPMLVDTLTTTQQTQTCADLLPVVYITIGTSTQIDNPQQCGDGTTAHTQTESVVMQQTNPTTLAYNTIGTLTDQQYLDTGQAHLPSNNNIAVSTQQTQTCENRSFDYTHAHESTLEQGNFCDDFLISTETQTSFTQLELPDNYEAYSNTQHTQTCDVLLNELHPNSSTSSNSPIVQKEQTQQTDLNYATTGTSTQEFLEATKCLQSDDFLVSTETQTSFTQCLLAESTLETDDTEALYNTQYTQTCDELFNELFGEQVNFQSAYTQTG